jgi:alkyl sulfatase BDS1-like metallo-beta-lactamase superfamily hydrolase
MRSPVHPSLWRHGLDGIAHTGDPAVLGRLTALLDTPDPAFPIVTP